MRELLDTGRYILVNNTDKCIGGPWTWIDPSNPKNKSCLDFVIVSRALFPFVKELAIDSDRKFAMCRIIREKGSFKPVFTDHLILILRFHKLPQGKPSVEKVTMWNYNKEGAWERFSELTNKYFDKFINDIEDKNIPIDEILEKFNKIQNKIKFQAFGKITIKNQVVSGNSAKTKPTELEKKSHVRNAVSDSVEKPNPLTTEGKLIKDILVR